jgi:drug/metabolite transporter (DMT)-like permease
MCWASAFVGIRALADAFSPGALSLGRLAIATAALGVLVIAKNQATPWPRRDQWRSLIVIGLLWFGLYNVALNYAEHHIDAGTASMILQLSPLLIAILAAVFLGEPATTKLMLGIGLGFAGVVLISLASGDLGSSTTVTGVLLCVVCCFAYSISVIFQKPLVSELSAIQVTWLACGVGFVSCLPFVGQLLGEWRQASQDEQLWLVYLGVFPTAIAFTTYAYALQHMSASKLGVTTYLVPPLAIGLSWVLLAEVPAPLAYGGGALTLIGVAVARSQSGRAQGGSDSSQPRNAAKLAVDSPRS